MYHRVKLAVVLMDKNKHLKTDQVTEMNEHGFIPHGWGSIVMTYEPGCAGSAVGWLKSVPVLTGSQP